MQLLSIVRIQSTHFRRISSSELGESQYQLLKFACRLAMTTWNARCKQHVYVCRHYGWEVAPCKSQLEMSSEYARLGRRVTPVTEKSKSSSNPTEVDFCNPPTIWASGRTANHVRSQQNLPAGISLPLVPPHHLAIGRLPTGQWTRPGPKRQQTGEMQ